MIKNTVLMIYFRKPLTILILSLLFPILYGQTELEQEIISSLIAAEFNCSPDNSKIDGNTRISDLKNQQKPCIIIIIETLIQTIDPKVDSLERFQRNGLSGLDLYTMNDFIIKNICSVKIKGILVDQIKIIYMSQEEWNGIIEQGGWNQYHTTYGHIPTVKLSRPGINENLKKAFIYYDSISDKLGGAGFYLILEKVNEQWVVKEKILSWMS